MSDTFTAAPTYKHKFPASAADSATNFSWPRGMTGQGFMVGEDGNHYFMEWPGHIGNDHAASLGCVETGTTKNISRVEFEADFGASAGTEWNRIPVPGTKYFWIISISVGEAPMGYDFRYEMVMYKIVNSTTVTAIRVHTADCTGLQSWLDSEIFLMGYNPFTSKVRILTLIRNSHVIEGISFAYVDIDCTEDDSIKAFDNWHYIEDFDEHFLDLLTFGVNGTNDVEGGAALVFNSDLPQMLFYVSASSWDAIQADPTHSAQWSSITGVGMYRFNFGGINTNDTDEQGFSYDGGGNTLFVHQTGGSIEGPLAGFDFSDAGLNHDGSDNNPPPGLSTNRPVSDYTSIVPFYFHGTQYVLTNKTFQSTPDLTLNGSGTLVKTVIYTYDGETVTRHTTFETGLFDMVSDAGADPSAHFATPPHFVTVGQVGDELWYLWGVNAIAGDPAYVVGRLASGVHTAPPSYRVIFSELRDTTYRDWVTSGEPLEFTAYLDTWWALQDDAALWMEAPWLTTYLATGDDLGSTNHPQLFLTPRWEWTDAVESHKWGTTVPLYRDNRPNSTTADARHRIRGRGRALQLHYESQSQRPFNLFGWSIDIDRNAQP